jgi:hypothetical protein
VNEDQNAIRAPTSAKHALEKKTLQPAIDRPVHISVPSNKLRGFKLNNGGQNTEAMFTTSMNSAGEIRENSFTMRSILTQNCAAKRQAYKNNLAFAVTNCSLIPASGIQIVQDSLERLDQVLVKMGNLICHALVSLKKLYVENVFDMVSKYLMLYISINNDNAHSSRL